MSNTIANTVNSILSQRSKSFEVIFVDDGSIDDSIEIVKNALESSQVDFKIYYQSNSGVSSARNKGLKYAKGDYVLFLDADDLIYQDFFVSLEPLLVSHDLISYRYSIVNQDLKTSKSMGIFNDGGNVDVGYEMDRYYQIKQSRMKFHISSIVFRRRFLIENDIIFDESLKSGEDSLFVLTAMFLSKSFYNLNRPLFYYLKIDGSVTNSYNLRLLDSFRAFSMLSIFFIDKKMNNLAQLNDLKSLILIQFNLFKLKQRAKELSVREFLRDVGKLYPNLPKEMKQKVINSSSSTKGIKLNLLWLEAYLFCFVFGFIFRRAQV